MANDRAGEVDLELGDKTYRLKLTLGAIRSLERARGCGWQEIVVRVFHDRLFFDDIVEIIRAGIEGAGDKPPAPTEVSDLVEEHGLAEVLPSVRLLVSLQSLGGKKRRELARVGAGDEGKASTGSA